MTTLTPGGQKLADALESAGILSRRSWVWPSYQANLNAAATSLALEPPAGTGDRLREAARKKLCFTYCGDGVCTCQNRELTQEESRLVMGALFASTTEVASADLRDALGEPHCWVIPGRDTANNYGAVDAHCVEQGEMTRPLWSFEAIQSAVAALAAPEKGQPVAGVGEALAEIAAELSDPNEALRYADGWPDGFKSGEFAEFAANYLGSYKGQVGSRRLLIRAAAFIVSEMLLIGTQPSQPPEAAAPSGSAGEDGPQCERCQGNGEIVTDWDRYLHSHDGDVGDEAVAECPDCYGYGRTGPSSATQQPAPKVPVADAVGDVGSRIGSPHFVEAVRNRLIGIISKVGETTPLQGMGGRTGQLVMSAKEWEHLYAGLDAELEKHLSTAMDEAVRRAALTPPQTARAGGGPETPADDATGVDHLKMAEQFAADWYGGPIEVCGRVISVVSMTKRVVALLDRYAAIASAPATRPGDGVERVRHVKRGTEYEVLGEAEAQVSDGESDRFGNWIGLYEGDKLVIYRDPATGKLWCRTPKEFRDGRFATLAPAPAANGEGA